jgi:thiosulfate dehydrogenase (quinone) large subunit
MSARPYAPWLLILRLYAGVFWLLHGWQKVTDPAWAAPRGTMSSELSKMVGDTPGAYHDFVTGMVLPNVVLFAHLVAWGETLTGVSLFLGLLTPIGALVGMFLALNYFLANGVDVDALSGFNALAFVMSFMCLVLPVGMIFGLDGQIRGRRSPSRVPGGVAAK